MKSGMLGTLVTPSRVILFTAFEIFFTASLTYVTAIMIPNQVIDMVGDDRKDMTLGIILATSSILSAWTGALSGYLSDQIGQRRVPFIAIGTLIWTGSILIRSACNSFLGKGADSLSLLWIIVLSYATVTTIGKIAYTIAQVPYTAMLVDVFPKKLYPIVSGMIGFFTLLGTLFGITFFGFLYHPNNQFWIAFCICLLTVLLMVPLFFFKRHHDISNDPMRLQDEDDHIIDNDGNNSNVNDGGNVNDDDDNDGDSNNNDGYNNNNQYNDQIRDIEQVEQKGLFKESHVDNIEIGHHVGHVSYDSRNKNIDDYGMEKRDLHYQNISPGSERENDEQVNPPSQNVIIKGVNRVLRVIKQLIQPFKSRNFLLIFCSSFMTNLGVAPIGQYFLYFIRDLIHPNYGIFNSFIHTKEQGQALYMIGMFGTSLIVSPLTGIAATRFRPYRKFFMIISGATSVIGTAMFTITLDYNFIVLASVFWGISAGVNFVTTLSLVNDNLPDATKSAAKDLGIWGVAKSFPQILASPIAGTIIGISRVLYNRDIIPYKPFGFTVLFGLCSFCQVAAALFMLFLKQDLNKS